MRSTSSFEMPDLPKACMRCGTPYGLTRQPFSLLTRGQGALPLRRHWVDLPFCQACWNRFVTARLCLRIAIGVAAVAIAGGLGLSIATASPGPGLVGSALGAATLGVAVWFLRHARPKKAKTPVKGVVLDVPAVGEVRVPGPGDERNP